MEVIRMNYDITFTDRVCATALSMMYTGVTQARDFDDEHGLKEKTIITRVDSTSCTSSK
jgi:hypothetical protein